MTLGGARRGISSTALALALVACSGHADDDGSGTDRADETGLEETGTSATSLEGDPSSRAADAIPDLPYDPALATFADFPVTPGVPFSTDTIALVLADDATVEQANGLLAAHHASIVGGFPPMEAGALGVLMLRLPTSTHAELDAELEILRADPGVAAAARDARMRGAVLPAPRSGFEWSFGAVDGSGAWGLEEYRVPAMWNVPIRSRVDVAVIDLAFVRHTDLMYARNTTDPAIEAGLDETNRLHGLRCASVLGATWGNEGMGIDGVGKDAVSVHGIAPGSMVESWAGMDLGALRQALTDATPARVVSESVGYEFPEDPTPAEVLAITETPEFAAELQHQRRVLEDFLAGLSAARQPLLFYSAGNENGSDGRMDSPGCHLATDPDHRRRGTYCVEALARDGTLAPFSNVNGTHAAPGADVGVLDPGPDFYFANGTSEAAPWLAGVVATMLAVEPSLTNAQVDAILYDPAVRNPVNKGVDAFQAVLAIDPRRSSSRVLRSLLDVDDGTPDGNLRVDVDGQPVTPGSPDGAIDMGDFRRFRDALLQVEAAGVLDGAPQDLNGDGVLATGDFDTPEGVWPRVDFNGDGVLSRDEVALVPGLGAVTDLGMLQAQFADPHVDASELPALLDSVDVHAHFGDCLSDPAVASVTAFIDDGGTPLDVRVLDAATPEEVFTVPSGFDRRLFVDALDARGGLVSRARVDMDAFPGADVHVVGCRPVGTIGCVNVSEYSDAECGFGGTIGDLQYNGVTHTEVARTTPLGSRSGTIDVNERGVCVTEHADVTTEARTSVFLFAVVAREALPPSPIQVRYTMTNHSNSENSQGETWFSIQESNPTPGGFDVEVASSWIYAVDDAPVSRSLTFALPDNGSEMVESYTPAATAEWVTLYFGADALAIAPATGRADLVFELGEGACP